MTARTIFLFFLCGLPLAHGGTDCVAAVKIAINAAASMNETWWHSCLIVARDDPRGKQHCNNVHAEFAKVFHDR